MTKSHDQHFTHYHLLAQRACFAEGAVAWGRSGRHWGHQETEVSWHEIQREHDRPRSQPADERSILCPLHQAQRDKVTNEIQRREVPTSGESCPTTIWLCLVKLVWLVNPVWMSVRSVVFSCWSVYLCLFSQLVRFHIDARSCVEFTNSENMVFFANSFYLMHECGMQGNVWIDSVSILVLQCNARERGDRSASVQCIATSVNAWLLL